MKTKLLNRFKKFISLLVLSQMLLAMIPIGVVRAVNPNPNNVINDISIYDGTAETSIPLAGATIDGDDYPDGINFVADVGNAVGTVRFELNGDTYYDSEKPFTAFGDNDDKNNPEYFLQELCELPEGTYNLVATPNTSGNPDDEENAIWGTPYTRQITFVNIPDCDEENQPPVITVLGDDPLYLELGSAFIDPGATALDPEDGDITGDIVVSGDTVDTSALGVYTFYYDVMDSEGLSAVQKSRTVIVQDTSEPETFGVNYDGNGNTGGAAPVDAGDYLSGASVTVLGPGTLVKTGYSFDGWNTSSDGSGTAYVEDGSFSISGDTTLFAQWSINQYTITFDSAGGSAVAPITQDFGSVVNPPTDPTRAGYTFTGWSPQLPGTMPEGGLTVVAQWILDEENNDGGGDEGGDGGGGPGPGVPPIVIPPTILTPILSLIPAITAPVVAAEANPEVLSEAVESPEVKGAETDPVLGSSDTICPWWWIIGLIYLVLLAFVGGSMRALDRDHVLNRRYYLWPPILGGIAWLAHYFLHGEYEATWFCDNYWLVILLVVLGAELIYRYIVRRKQENR